MLPDPGCPTELNLSRDLGQNPPDQSLLGITTRAEMDMLGEVCQGPQHRDHRTEQEGKVLGTNPRLNNSPMAPSTRNLELVQAPPLQGQVQPPEPTLTPKFFSLILETWPG